MAINPKGVDLKRFLAEDDGGPVVMLNLLRFKEQNGRTSYQEYGRRFAKFAKGLGAEVLYLGLGSTVLIAEAGQSWDAVLIVRYPTRKAFSQMVADPEYQTFTHFRTEALVEAVLQATTAWAF